MQCETVTKLLLDYRNMEHLNLHIVTFDNILNKSDQLTVGILRFRESLVACSNTLTTAFKSQNLVDS